MYNNPVCSWRPDGKHPIPVQLCPDLSRSSTSPYCKVYKPASIVACPHARWCWAVRYLSVHQHVHQHSYAQEMVHDCASQTTDAFQRIYEEFGSRFGLEYYHRLSCGDIANIVARIQTVQSLFAPAIYSATDFASQSMIAALLS